ncbi:MAG: hypothetical protein IPN86_10495 [Saprospiraceae bacterium]|nr:hypothetical protein [Saprospiraceae bacterium]
MSSTWDAHGEQVDAYTNCDGGTITRTWTVTDLCGNSDTKTQVITLLPIPPALFTPFDDVTVACNMIPPASFLPELLYDNGLSGDCKIMGSIVPEREKTLRIVWALSLTLDV